MRAYLDTFNGDYSDLDEKRSAVGRQLDHFQSSSYRKSLAGTIGRDPSLKT